MDPVTHAVAARMGAAIGRAPMSRGAAVLSVVAGLAPDLDAVIMPAGWDLYLRVHEAGTHSLLGGIALSAVLAGLARRMTAEPHRARRHLGSHHQAGVASLAHPDGVGPCRDGRSAARHPGRARGDDGPDHAMA